MNSDSGYYVQIHNDDGWQTVFKGDDRHQAAALASLIWKSWDIEARSLSLYSLRRAEGMKQFYRAEQDLAELDGETTAQVATLAVEAQDLADDALVRVTAAKQAVIRADQHLRETMLIAQDYEYSMRKIGAAMGMSQERVRMMIQEVSAA